MIKPHELSFGLPMQVADKVISTMDKVWYRDSTFKPNIKIDELDLSEM